MREYDTSLNGLTDEQVKIKTSEGKINYFKATVGKTYFQIIRDNLLTFFNILLFIIAGLMIYAQYYTGLFFLVILIPNIAVGLYEDIKAKHLMNKLKVDTDPRCIVIRNGIQLTIPSDKIVEGDLILLKTNSQICVDGIVVSGKLTVNESLITGESTNVTKGNDDEVLSGSYVTSGKAYVRVTRVGKNSFVNSLSDKAKKFKRSPSEILKTLKRLFLVIGIIVICIGIFTVILYAVQGKFSTSDGFKQAIGPISGSMVGMIPSGLYLLTSSALAVAVLSLSKKGARVQDFYSVEMLARSSVLCIDKTGTITDGTMKLTNVITFKRINKGRLAQIVSTYLKAVGDDNFTAEALKKEFNKPSLQKGVSCVPFNSSRKFSAVTFDSGKTYVLGAPEAIPSKYKDSVLKAAQKYTENGFRVLAFYKSDYPMDNGKIKDDLKPICLFVLRDNIKPNVKETFSWFKDYGVKIKVISGDNELTVSAIAREAGVEGADKYISLVGKSDEEVKQLAPEYNVFGRATPEQKAIIVNALKEHGEKVAMTGDGVNDILALKRADCSIAMGNGSDAARNASHIVLLENDFNSLPKIVGEGRRVVNNLQRTASLFLCKTLFTMFYSLLFLILSAANNDPTLTYPFRTNHLFIWEIFTIGLVAFFIALEPCSELINGKFMKNVLKKVIPGATMLIAGAGLSFIGYLLSINKIWYLDITTMNIATNMAVIIFTILAIFIFYKVCSPFTKWRKWVFIFGTCGTIIALGVAALISYLGGAGNLFLIDFAALSPLNYFTCLIIIVVLAALYFCIHSLVKEIKGWKNNENK